MLTTLAIISSHIVVALLARKRKMGFTKALVMSLFLTPLLTLPVVLRSKKIAQDADKTSGQESPPQQRTADSPGEGKTEGEVREESEANKYGYKEGGKVISDSFILSESNDKAFLGKKVPLDRQKSISADVESKDRSVHL
ncbi:MAG: hypothetical protein ACI3ZC_06180 [Candidatus Cryptobacteroides sp.]